MERPKRRIQSLLLFGVIVLTVIGVPGLSLLRSMNSTSDLLSVGTEAPDFTAQTDSGATVRLSEYRGKRPVVLVFYPGDNTPVCTAQLCALRDNWEHLKANNTAVFGINPADREKHKGFSANNHLPFPLIVDSGETIAAKYGCKAALAIIKRTVYVVDVSGKIRWAERGNPAPDEILKALNQLTTANH